MLPILSLLGLTLASIFLPDSQADADEGSGGKQEHVSDQKTASGSYDTAEDATTQVMETLSGTDENDTPGLIDLSSADDQMAGTVDDDILWGQDGSDSMWGDAGWDTLFGGAGDDFLYGDDDSEGDELIGGEGNDIIFAGQFDHVTLGAGDDVLKAESDAAVHVSDFNPDDDRIEVIYEKGTEPPTLDTVRTDTGIQLKADDSIVAILDGISSIDLSQVKLIAA